MQIHINGEPFEVGDTSLTFERVARFAGHDPMRKPTITWSTIGVRPQTGDYMKPGETVELREGMHFIVLRAF